MARKVKKGRKVEKMSTKATVELVSENRKKRSLLVKWYDGYDASDFVEKALKKMKKQKVKFTLEGIEQELLNGKGEFEKLAEGSKKEIKKAQDEVWSTEYFLTLELQKGNKVLFTTEGYMTKEKTI